MSSGDGGEDRAVSCKQGLKVKWRIKHHSEQELDARYKETLLHKHLFWRAPKVYYLQIKEEIPEYLNNWEQGS